MDCYNNVSEDRPQIGPHRSILVKNIWLDINSEDRFPSAVPVGEGLVTDFVNTYNRHYLPYAFTLVTRKIYVIIFFMRSFTLTKQTYKVLTLKTIIISLVVSFLVLLLSFPFFFYSAVLFYSVGSTPDLIKIIIFMFMNFLIYNLLILLPMALIGKTSKTNPIKISLVMYIPFILFILDMFIGGNIFGALLVYLREFIGL